MNGPVAKFTEHMCGFEDPVMDEDCMCGFPFIGTLQDLMHLQVMLEHRVFDFLCVLCSIQVYGVNNGTLCSIVNCWLF